MFRGILALTVLAIVLAAPGAAAAQQVQYFELPEGARPHDVAAVPGGPVWYTAQRQGALGILDPQTGAVKQVPLGEGSAPHGVIVGPDGAAWITDSGQNAMVRYDPQTEAVRVWPLPEDTGYANLNTAAFDGRGRIWFTGQSGIYGVLNPATDEMQVWQAPRGRGPYGITATPSGDIYYVSLAGNHLAKVDLDTGAVTVIEPPTADQGARRVWSDSTGKLWVSEWNSGNLSRYDPASGEWKVYHPGVEGARTYSVWVDDQDKVWITEWTSNAIMRFDPQTETFESYPSNRDAANVRQMLGRSGEAWGAESGTDRLVVVHYD
jgi:virginiamycin B lyase